MLINIHVSNNNACAKCGALLTSGMVGARCAFSFGAEWTGLAKTAVFIAGQVQRDVLLTADECVIPWEVLEKNGYQLYIGVYGTNANGDLVIPTIYVNAGVVKKGADPNGEESVEPTPTIVEQIIAAAGTAVEVANSVRADADSGAFDGAQGERGPAGPSGKDGADGADAKINGYNTVNIVAGDNITIDQDGNTLTINGEADGGASDHAKLTNRDAANQHPISAIYGLQSALDGKQPIGDYATTQDVSDLADIVDTKADASDIPSLDGYATETYVNNHHDDTKQDVISDLSTIRSGASKGATAYQKPSSGIPASDLASGVIPSVPAALSQLSGDSTHRVVTDAEKSTWNAKQSAISDLAAIRSGASLGATAVQPEAGKGLFSGNYNDLTNKPTIPSAVTESTVSGWGFTKNTGTYSKPSGGIPKTDLASAVQTSLGKADTALQQHQDISGKENTSNKVTSISFASTNAQYPSAKAVYDFIQSLDGNGVAY